MGLVGLLAARLLRLPVTASYHTDVPELLRQLSSNPVLHAGARSVMSWFYRTVDRVFVFSEASRRRLVELDVPADRLEKIAVPIDPSEFSPDHACSEVLRSFGVCAGAPVVFARAQLDARLLGFVPPAWLLSRGAAAAVGARGFAFCERFTGIVRGDRVLARRLIGWGSRTAIEAIATSGWAWLQSRRVPVDTRVAVHPPDLCRGVTRRSLVRAVRALAARLEPVSYATYLLERDEAALPHGRRHAR